MTDPLIILREYDDTQDLYAAFVRKLVTLLSDILGGTGDYYQMVSRVKSRESLERKLLEKGSYSCLGDVTDIAGIRIVTYFADHVDRLASVILREFEIDWLRSIDHRKDGSEQESDRTRAGVDF